MQNILNMPVQVDVLEVDVLGTVPVVECKMFDERQTCAPVLLYLAGEKDGAPADYTVCPSYRDGKCRRTGQRALCAFHEPETATVWRKAATWRLIELADGDTAVTPSKNAVVFAAELGARIVGYEVLA